MKQARDAFSIFLLLQILQVCRANLPPIFSMDMNNLAISENTPIGSVIYTLEGSDPENSKVHFDLEGTDLLKVNRNTGEVTVVKPLDRETNDTLNIIVSIEDEVDTGRNNIVQVSISVIVLDENDNAPSFEQTPYQVSVPEDTPIGTTVFSHINVIDKDASGHNIEVECINLPEYQQACEFFTIIENTESSQNSYQGSIVLNKKLNYTKQRMYEFLLKASDGELSNTTNFVINVTDVQDTPPRFIGGLQAEIYENASINTLVIVVHAEDGDKGVPRRIMYELVNNPMSYFLLDAITGELRTARPLDKEAIDNPEGIITLDVKAHEMIDGITKGNDPLTVTEAKITVRVKDVNDEPPMFNKREYFIQIPENIPEGSPLPGLDMTVTDPDEGRNSVFSLELNDISGAFSIEPDTANGSTPVIIRVTNNNLDYEDLNQRKFIILAVARELYTANPLSSTATITVTVTDINDNAPTFDKVAYVAGISEMATSGTLVISIVAKDRDSGKFGGNGILYQLSGSGSDLFLVNNRTGTVSVSECHTPGQKPCLDYEDKSEYHLKFTATDDDGKGQTSIVPLKITLTDSNDNPPVFSQSIYRVFINEGAGKFNPDLIVEAKDADKTSLVSYSIISGNERNLFTIDSNSGKIRIVNNRGLDVSNETDNNINLNVMASDGKFTAITIVNITIKDVNNNSPKFTEENYIESIPENISIGSVVSQLIATDSDTGENAELEYAIQKGAYDDFKIDNSGIVTVISKLDFDRRNTYNIEIIARDHGDPSLTGTTTLTVNIINTNDKLPYFIPTTQKTEVMENALVGTVIHTLIALDPDVNTSEALNFAATEPITALDKYGNEIYGNDVYKTFFSVDKYTGKVTVYNTLQRDIAAVVRITVLVTDITAATVQQGKGLLIITITDVNDSPPKFLPPWSEDNPTYTLELKEEQPVGTIVATYEAIDEDSDIAGYQIWPESDYFQINNGTGIVQLKKQIDYEQTQSLNFTIVVFDSGIPLLNSTATVYVKVINLNDNDPIFSAESYNVSVEENSPNGTFVVKVEATDLDVGDFGTVSYDLIGEHKENFAISPQTGVITVANSLFFDHEVINETVLQVVANDNAPSHLKRSITVPIYVSILDVNDNQPKFNQSVYNVTVMENVRLNPLVPILQVNATDLDSGVNGMIHYKILEGNDNDIFLLGIETGILYPHKSLLGQARGFHLRIEARDEGGNGKQSDEAEINVEVLNVNEHEPIFIMPALVNSTVEITENTATENYLIMTVKANDPDENDNGRISYHLKVNGENVQETNEFSINEKTGELRSKIFLDREIKSKYELILVARDHGFPKWFETLRYLTILLVDINDNLPEFPDSKTTNPYHFYVTENGNKGIRIGQVKALDRDEGNHAKVYYYILYGNADGAFYLDKLDGSLFTNRSFDRESKDEYNLFILANNDPDFYQVSDMTYNEDEIMHDSSIAKVKITINDLNDNAPIFEQSIYYAAINVMTNVNDFVINVTASDPDLAENGSVTYYIKASNLYKYGSNKSSGSIIPSPFNITEKGEIFTATYLSENNQHRFVIDIIARENAIPEREAYTEVHVWIFDPEQLIRVILSRPTQEVRRERDEIIAELSNATQSLVIIDDIRYHIDDNGYKNEEWSDMYILVVDPKTQTIQAVPEVLKTIDSKYDFLKDYYAGFAIENVVPAFVTENKETFDPALAALIALIIVLIVGVITFIIVCCCLRHWVLSPSDLKKKDALIKKAIIDDLNTTENPLWIEQKLKIYEEQELTMQIFNEPEHLRRDSNDFLPDDNTYATIQHPHRRGSNMASMCLGDDLADYATLSGVQHNTDSAHSSLRGAPNYYEAAMGFQGSTFQVPERTGNDYDSYRTRFKGSELTINHEGQPEYVAELI